MFSAPSPRGKSDTTPPRCLVKGFSLQKIFKSNFCLRSGNFPYHVLILYSKILDDAILGEKNKREHSLGTRQEPLGTGRLGLYVPSNKDVKLLRSGGLHPPHVRWRYDQRSCTEPGRKAQVQIQGRYVGPCGRFAGSCARSVKLTTRFFLMPPARCYAPAPTPGATFLWEPSFGIPV